MKCAARSATADTVDAHSGFCLERHTKKRVGKIFFNKTHEMLIVLMGDETSPMTTMHSGQIRDNEGCPRCNSCGYR
jgi:hypothetical protein